jgi:DMSO reductase anchor subunit
MSEGRPPGERYEPRPRAAATQQGGSPDGRGEVRMVPEHEARNYYGRSVLKEPTWTWQVPWYLFAGGLAGASSALSLAARLSGNDRLARSALLTAMGAVSASPVLLITDLGRPERFYMMLRVIKPTSPMSVGTWILTLFGTSTGAAAASDLLGVYPRAGRAMAILSALLGPALSTYTAVLFAATSVPVWHGARRELPFVFAASSSASAGSAAAILTPVEDAGPARRLAVGGAVAELVLTSVRKRRLGTLLAEPYQRGETRRYEKTARVLTGAGAALMGLAGHKRRLAAIAGGALVFAGAATERWAVFKAEHHSARDPKYTVMPQRERLEARDGAGSLVR